MSRKRDEKNSKLGQHVQRRSGGTLELRFPLPTDVQPAFLDAGGRPRSQIIRSLGTSDVRLANAKADALRAAIRADISKIRQARGSASLDDFLQDLFDQELAMFRAQAADDARMVLVRPGANLLEERLGIRSRSTRALLSPVAEERLATAGWAAERFLRSQGREPDGSPEFQDIVDRCANVLVEALTAQNELAAGREVPVRTSSLLGAASGLRDMSNAVTPRASLKIRDYFKQVYLPAIQTAGNIRGQNTISGKAQAVELFADLVGDLSVGSITKGDLWRFHDELMVLPNSRDLKGADRDLTPREQIDALKSGVFIAATIHPKTINRHLSGVKTLMDFAEKRRDISSAPTGGIMAEVQHDDEAGRPFTTDELNRLFSQPLFTGSMDGLEPNGWRKPGPVQIRDDRFWIPLLLFFTGARPSEVAGLATSDVFPDHEVPHIIISPNSFRSLKNPKSKRMVPLHRRLIDFGFLDFAKARLANGEGQLFAMVEQQYFVEGPTGERRKKGLSSAPLMRQFNRTILADADARSDRGSAKCFRHTFEQEALAVINSEEVRRRLTGRDVNSTVQIYTQNVPTDPVKRAVQLRMLAHEVDKLIYEGVSLNHLDRVRHHPLPPV